MHRTSKFWRNATGALCIHCPARDTWGWGRPQQIDDLVTGWRPIDGCFLQPALSLGEPQQRLVHWLADQQNIELICKSKSRSHRLRNHSEYYYFMKTKKIPCPAPLTLNKHDYVQLHFLSLMTTRFLLKPQKWIHRNSKVKRFLDCHVCSNKYFFFLRILNFKKERSRKTIALKYFFKFWNIISN